MKTISFDAKKILTPQEYAALLADDWKLYQRVMRQRFFKSDLLTKYKLLEVYQVLAERHSYREGIPDWIFKKYYGTIEEVIDGKKRLNDAALE